MPSPSLEAIILLQVDWSGKDELKSRRCDGRSMKRVKHGEKMLPPEKKEMGNVWSYL
jgi:hypothetical protein